MSAKVRLLANLPADAEQRYQEVIARRDAIQAAWDELDRPLLERGSTGQLREHPLVKMLREHELLIDKLSVRVRRRHDGPEPSAVIKASIGHSPAARLRKVN